MVTWHMPVTPSPQAEEASTVALRASSRWWAVRHRVCRDARSAGVLQYLDNTGWSNFVILKSQILD